MKPRTQLVWIHRRALLALLGLVGLLTLFQCGPEEKAQADPQALTESAYPLELPPPRPSRAIYSAGRAAMLQRLVSDQKLSGATSQASFRHIRQLFGRLPADEAVPSLQEALRRLIAGGPETRTILQNACEAAAYLRDPRLVPILMEAAMLRHKEAPPHYHPGVQRAAIEAIGTCGTPEQAQHLWNWFFGLEGMQPPDGRGRALLLRSLTRIEGDRVAPRFQRLLEDHRFRNWFLPEVLSLTAELTAAAIAPVLAPLFEEFQGMDRLDVAEILHAGGDLLGTNFLQKELEKAREPGLAQLRARLVRALGKGPGERWKQEILAFSTDPSADVRFAVVESLEDATGEDALATLEVLSEDSQEMIRWAALRILARHRRSAALDSRFEILRGSSGTRFSQALRDLIEARDPRLAQEAARRIPGEESGRLLVQWMQVLTHLPEPTGLEPLLGIFQGPRRMLLPDRDSITFTALVLSNCADASEPVMALYRGALANDDLRRPHLLAFLARIVALPGLDSKTREGIMEFLLGVVGDPEADPRDRMVIPRLLIDQIDLDHALRLQRIMMREKNPTVRDALSAFLWEFF